MSKVIQGTLFSLVFFLTACGGGSSSGGGEAAGDGSPGTDTGGGSGTDGSGIAGTYIGTGNIVASALGTTESESGPIQIVIKEDNTVEFGEPGQPSVATGTLNTNGSQFTLNFPASFLNEPDFTCTGTLVIMGTVAGGTISGTFSGADIVCLGVPVEVTGDFNAERIDAGSQGRTSSGLIGEMKSGLMHRLVD